MLRITIIALVLFMSSFSWSQLTPKKIKNNDLRSTKKVISLSYSKKLNEFDYSLLKSAQGEFHLKHNINQKLVKSQKLGTENANEMDAAFADKFITMKYMMSEKQKSKCKVYYLLFMHGEDFKVCDGDKHRVSLIKELITIFKKKLI